MEEINEVQRQLANDDPDLVRLVIGRCYYYPPDGDYGALGTDIGRSTHLRELEFCANEDFEKGKAIPRSCLQSI